MTADNPARAAGEILAARRPHPVTDPAVLARVAALVVGAARPTSSAPERARPRAAA